MAPNNQATINCEAPPKGPVTIEEPAPIHQEPTPSTRPTTAGKGISETTLAAWRDAEAEYIAPTIPYHSIDEQQDDLVTVTESIYEYHVHRREWPTADPEGEQKGKTLGTSLPASEEQALCKRI